MIRPQPRPDIRGKIAFTIRKTPVRLMPMTLFQSASDISVNAWVGKKPAQLTSTSTWPALARAKAASFAQLASSEMSAARVKSFAPSAEPSASLARASSVVSVAMTLSPWARKRLAKSAPIHPAAPVIRTTRPLSMSGRLPRGSGVFGVARRREFGEEGSQGPRLPAEDGAKGQGVALKPAPVIPVEHLFEARGGGPCSRGGRFRVDPLRSYRAP